MVCEPVWPNLLYLLLAYSFANKKRSFAVFFPSSLEGFPQGNSPCVIVNAIYCTLVYVLQFIHCDKIMIQ